LSSIGVAFNVGVRGSIVVGGFEVDFSIRVAFTSGELAVTLSFGVTDEDLLAGELTDQQVTDGSHD